MGRLGAEHRVSSSDCSWRWEASWLQGVTRSVSSVVSDNMGKGVTWFLPLWGLSELRLPFSDFPSRSCSAPAELKIAGGKAKLVRIGRCSSVAPSWTQSTQAR
mmetsp:Transcript_129361/g.413357  ORF Transcript_129361/g.413357 Transcript_129361/m.413357 type:complete len:103 (-) Transcript_129361:585-893(-)